MTKDNVLPFVRKQKSADPYEAYLIAAGRATATRLGIDKPAVAKVGAGMLCGVSIVQAITGPLTIHDCAKVECASVTNCIYSKESPELGVEHPNTPVKAGIVVIVHSGMLAISFN